MRLGCWNGAEAATQDFQKIVNTVAAELEVKDLDVFGICEANVFPNTVTSCLKIPGYTLEVGNGVNKATGANARVICYVSDALEYKRRSDLEDRNTMPAIWLELGNTKKTRFIFSIVYREHKSWRGQEEELRLSCQQKRWRDWLNSYQDVWDGEKEALVMGDFNLQRKESGCKARMQLDARSKLLAKGWTQMMADKTFKSKSQAAGKKDAGSNEKNL